VNVGAWVKGHRTETILGAGGIVVTIALYVRSRNNAAANSGTGTSQTFATPTGTADTTNSDLYNGLEGQIGQLQQAVASIGATAGAGTTPAAAPTSPVTPSPQAQTIESLPWVGPNVDPNNITTQMVSQYGPFEEIGQEVNGVYEGPQVAGGVPLFAQFGSGFFQNFGLKGGPSPNYSGPVFVPEQYAEYVNYTGTVSGKPS